MAHTMPIVLARSSVHRTTHVGGPAWLCRRRSASGWPSSRDALTVEQREQTAAEIG